MILLTKLLLAHIIGDFLLQPSGWVKEKALKKHTSLLIGTLLSFGIAIAVALTVATALGRIP